MVDALEMPEIEIDNKFKIIENGWIIIIYPKCVRRFWTRVTWFLKVVLDGGDLREDILNIF